MQRIPFPRYLLPLFLFVLCSSLSQAEALGWVRKTPSYRMLNAMAYDEQRQRTVLFGGWNAGEGDPGLSDTWEWDGEQWIERKVLGPSPRWIHSMTYDSNRSRVVLHGGIAAAPDGGPMDLFDTWEWDGITWQRVCFKAPFDAPIVYDKAHGLTISLSRDGKTYGWDGNQWMLLDESGPVERVQHAMAYDEIRSEVVLFGGGDSSLGNETWTWNGYYWHKKNVTAPLPNVQHSMAFDSIHQCVVMFGGYNYLDKTWLWDGELWSFVYGKTPPHGRYSSMVFDRSRGETVLFGGSSPAMMVSDERGIGTGTWTFDGKNWNLASALPPYHVANDLVYDAAHRNTLLFIGQVESNLVDINQKENTYTWDGVRWTIHNLPIHPSNRIEHKMAYDSIHKGVWLYGGYYQNEEYRDDLWFWDGSEWKEIASSGPGGRSSAAMAYDPKRNVLVLFGGFTGSHAVVKRLSATQYMPFLNDTWEWDGISWKLAATNGPEPRRFSTLVYDTAHDRMLLFGGSQTYEYSMYPIKEFQDVWAWDGQNWQELEIHDTPDLSSGTVFYWPDRASLVMLGFASGSPWGAWILQESTWRPLSYTPPHYFIQNGVALDTQRNQFVLQALNTWELDANELMPADSQAQFWNEYGK